MASFDDPPKEQSLLEKLDSMAPIRHFDAFPKVQQSYTKSTGFGGVATIIVIIMSFFLSLNDLGEFVWGWPDYEFAVDRRMKSALSINLDMTVNMPCHYLSVDVRDTMGDRIHLSDGFRRDGTTFDVGQAHTLRSHADQQSITEVVTSARKKSGGLFAFWKAATKPTFKPTYNHVPSGSACRIYGSTAVKRVTGNLHITTLGHGYGSYEHTDHQLMNLSHVITEFSFGPYIPNIAQPLDNSLETTSEPFTVFQYFLTVVPTVYFPARSPPLRTNQYSATNYRRTIEHGRGTPGIFFKYDVEPLEMTIHQRTTTLAQFLIRIAGIIGGVWVCAAWAVKIGMKAVKVTGVVEDDDDDTIVKDVRSRKSSLGRRWAGGELRARTSSATTGWAVDSGSGFSSPYGSYSPYSTTPAYPTTPSLGVNTHVGTQLTANTHAYSSPAAVPLPTTPTHGNGHTPSPGLAPRPPPNRVGTTPYSNGLANGSSTSISSFEMTVSPVGNGSNHSAPNGNGTPASASAQRNGSTLNPMYTNGVAKKAD